MDAAGLLIKNVYRPLQEVATHKGSHIQQLISFREILENMLDKDSNSLTQVPHVARNVVWGLGIRHIQGLGLSMRTVGRRGLGYFVRPTGQQCWECP